MNEVIQNIHIRRSVRFFSEQGLSGETIYELIQAANAAPTGANTQPWRFVVITKPETRSWLASLAKPRYEAWLAGSEMMQQMRKEIDEQTTDPVYYNAPVIVFVVGNGQTADTDCPMAMENLMLAARSLGIGSCWTYFGQLVVDIPEVQLMLDLNEGDKVFGPLVLGYPRDGFPGTPQKRLPQIKWITD